MVQVLLLFTFVVHVQSSGGDRAGYYRRCLGECAQKLCPLIEPEDSVAAGANENSGEVIEGEGERKREQQRSASARTKTQQLDPNWEHDDWWMRFMRWDCLSECKYECMQDYSLYRKTKNLPPEKFYGKWPFVRVMGVQELFSSGASFLNGVPHAVYLLTPRLRSKFSGEKGYYMRMPLLVFSVVAINSWLWSTIFHARDKPFTEAADYFFATMQLMYSMWLAAFRIGRSEGLGRWARLLSGWGLGCGMVGFYCYYLNSMLFVLFDYGWHMKINGVLVGAHFISWIIWSLSLGKKRSYKWQAIGFLAMVLLAASCEVFDFAPVWGLIDAHATWHCLTAPMLPLWYQFWIEDTAFEMQRISRGIKGK
ncbi:hypothetical protein TrVE_jg2326 [Triparma verrucosa]|uniref:Post-GPI attachment to proteins factor 3 n=1 Tax=Triparma verrucosa TaxID=1606542 RepID=A0A9W7FKC9_9STRA|nr:hypothetical protein TrVE_jg2326 [Triparma verrucosa]